MPLLLHATIASSGGAKGSMSVSLIILITVALGFGFGVLIFGVVRAVHAQAVKNTKGSERE
ncbi:MAG: hypothetical protein WCT11_03605 [Candidatus Magasanikbacteria bacterium]